MHQGLRLKKKYIEVKKIKWVRWNLWKKMLIHVANLIVFNMNFSLLSKLLKCGFGPDSNYKTVFTYKPKIILLNLILVFFFF